MSSAASIVGQRAAKSPPIASIPRQRAANSSPPAPVVVARSAAKVPEGGWREGHVAFMKKADALSPRDHDALIASRYLPESATGHPVVVLRVSETHLVVTPVSAYNAAAQKFLAPWRQGWHRGNLKERLFRAFAGSQRPCPHDPSPRPLLELLPGMAMPKPRESWVYVDSVWCLPLTAIGKFNKVDGFMMMAPESFASLREHMDEVGGKWTAASAFLDAILEQRRVVAAEAKAKADAEAAALAAAEAKAIVDKSAPLSRSSSTHSLESSTFSLDSSPSTATTASSVSVVAVVAAAPPPSPPPTKPAFSWAKVAAAKPPAPRLRR